MQSNEDPELSSLKAILIRHGITEVIPVRNAAGIGWARKRLAGEGTYKITRSIVRQIMQSRGLDPTILDAYQASRRSSYEPGTVHGAFTIERIIPPTLERPHRMFEVRCQCGARMTRWYGEILKNRHGCKACYTKVMIARWSRTEEVPHDFWRRLNLSAEQRGLAVTVTSVGLWELFTRQRMTCALSGVPLTLYATPGDPRTASLDRIEPEIGYLPGNVQWVHKDINRAKQMFSQDQFIALCRSVAEHQATLSGQGLHESHRSATSCDDTKA